MKCELRVRVTGARYNETMLESLVVSAFMMGLGGGASHCLSMCGMLPLALTAAPSATGVRPVVLYSANVAQHSPFNTAAGGAWGTQRRLWAFLAGRLMAYGLLGMLAAAMMQALGWFSIAATVLRPVWSMVHALGLAWGLFLLIFARQPVWLVQSGHALTGRLQRLLTRYDMRAACLVGMVLALLPCGLLYSAVMVAVLSNSFWQGGVVMAAFAVGSSVALAALGLAGQYGSHVQRVRGLQRYEKTIYRLAGLALMGLSLWAMYMALFRLQAPWC